MKNLIDMLSQTINTIVLSLTFTAVALAHAPTLTPEPVEPPAACEGWAYWTLQC